MNISINTASQVRSAIMSDYAISPESTGWTLSEKNAKTILVSDNCATVRTARAYWIDIFLDLGILSQENLTVTDKAIMEAEESNIRA